MKCIWELLSGRDLIPSKYNNDENGLPYITGASNFSDGKVNPIRWTPTPQVITDFGDILITCKGTVGEMAINDFGKAHIARQVMAIRNIYNLNTEYLSFKSSLNAGRSIVPPENPPSLYCLSNKNQPSCI